MTVRAEKLPFIKDAGFSTRRPFIALVNLADNSMQLQEFDLKSQLVEKKFKIKPQEKGTCEFRAYVVTTDGQLERSAKDSALKIE